MWCCQSQTPDEGAAELVSAMQDPPSPEKKSGQKTVAFGSLTRKDTSSLQRQQEKEVTTKEAMTARKRTIAANGFAGKYWKEGEETPAWVDTTLCIEGDMDRLVVGPPKKAEAVCLLQHVHHVYTAHDRGHFDDKVFSSLKRIGAKPELVVLLVHSEGKGKPRHNLIVLVDKAEHRDILVEAVRAKCLDHMSNPPANVALLASTSRLTLTGVPQARFMESFQLTDDKLGEGSFGVVFTCVHRETNEEFVVKMVDKVEMPIDDIKSEFDFLRGLNHPNIVGAMGTLLYERCFVCIVMDRYAGGDLVKAIQRHTKAQKKVEPHHLAPIAHQMLCALAYIHGESVVHRDIKGDNFLLSMMDFTSPSCSVVLTDFGLSRSLEKSGRLKDGVGSKNFWSPEHFGKDHGQKIDVWALGVIIYGVITGRFPFKDSHGIRFKEVKIPSKVPPVCGEWVSTLLEKEERKRPAAADLLDHVWFSTAELSASVGAFKSERSEGGAGGMSMYKSEESFSKKSQARAFGQASVHEGIKQRRQELLDRLSHTPVSRSSKEPLRSSFLVKHSVKWKEKKFSVHRQDLKCSFEWWKSEELKKAKLLSDLEKKAQPLKDNVDEAGHLEHLKKLLQEHNVDLEPYGKGKAKTLPQLAKEVRTGECRLMQDAQAHKKIVRVVDVVLLNLQASNGSDTRVLVEFYEDSKGAPAKRLPGTKKEAHENNLQTMGRVLKDVGLEMDQADLQTTQIRFEEETTSSSYPGFRTVYRKEMIEGFVLDEAMAVATQVGLPGYTDFSAVDENGRKKTYTWLTQEQVEKEGLNALPEQQEFVSSLVAPPVGLGEDDLTQELENMGIDLTKYDSDEAISFREFSTELMRGETTLSRDPAGKALRLADSVILILQNKVSGEFLVQVKSESPEIGTVELSCFPSVECRPNEDHFLSAKRLLRRRLDIDDNDVKFSQDVTLVEEEHPDKVERQRDLRRYPGLKTLYRRRLIKAELQ